MEPDVTRQPLAPLIERAVERALASGALGPIDTRTETVTDGGIDFVVRTVAGLARKEAAAARGQGADPFRPPYEPDLLVGAVRPGHVALLNKFPVLPGHLLVATREYAPQEEKLERGDCEALLRVLAAMDGLAFYNSGRVSGASQSHRHLQCVALDRPAPLAARMNPGRGGDPALPYPHAAAPLAADWLDDPAAGAAALHGRYVELLRRVGADAEPPHPYNLLATRDRLWLVPRTRERCGPVGVNALGFAGLLLAGDDDQADYVRRTGPLNVLAAVAGRPGETA